MWAYAALAAAQLLGGYQQADMIRKNGDLQASINNMNAKYQELDAFNAAKQGYTEADRYAAVADATMAKQKTDLAGQKVDVNYGTATDIEADSKVTTMLNTLEIQRQGREKALGYQTQAINTRLGGQMTELQASMDAAATESKGIFSAISTGISGYDRYHSTGTGERSKSGSNSTPLWRMASSYTDGGSPGGYGSGPKWYADDNSSGPGFFGNHPRDGVSLFS